MAKLTFHVTALAAIAACTWSLVAHAGVSPAEAAKLKGELTPVGAERAGNKEGTIPAWSGGLTTPTPGDAPGKRRGDPFKDEKPQITITAKNMAQYADKLTPGIAAMLKKYPETFHLNVYPTRRTAAMPQWVYDNTFKNATRGKMEGDMPHGVAGGVPFPIPKTGAEIVWNHQLRWRPASYNYSSRQWQVTQNGRPIMVSDSVADTELPYFFQDAAPESMQSGPFWKSRFVNSGPPLRAGEGIVGYEDFDPSKTQTWVYLSGQRRVRKLPNACCDTPAPAAAGIIYFDEVTLLAGRIDRFDWKLAGKKEMYIPYNSNRMLQPAKDTDVLGKNHINSDLVRWELHRVWVLEAELRAGQRHTNKRSTYYCDEDSWVCVLAERYDGKDQLWRVLFNHVYVAPDIPAIVDGPWGAYDLIAGSYFVANLVNEKTNQFVPKPKYPNNFFTPEALAGEGVR
jgi:hypothetical protein